MMMKWAVVFFSLFMPAYAFADTEEVPIYKSQDKNTQTPSFSDKPKAGAVKEILEVEKPDPATTAKAEERIKILQQSNQQLERQLSTREQRKIQLKDRLEAATARVKVAEENLQEVEKRHQEMEEEPNDKKSNFAEDLEVLQARSALLRAREQQARIESEYYSYRVEP